MALLDQAKTATDNQNKPITKETILNDDDSDGDNSDAAQFLTPGKKKLRSAQRDLRKALEEWEDAMLVGTTVPRC